jgi:hypothetical protein
MNQNYTKHATPPPTALKAIMAGRMKGKSDINPQWRIQALTESYGLCGIGWKYVITKQWLETGANEQIAAFCNEWSSAIPGTGGSSFVAKESSGLYVSDECFKMALTDAISVACKAIGIASNIYLGITESKYNAPVRTEQSNFAPKELPTLKVGTQEYEKVANYMITGGDIKQVKTKFILIPEVEKILTNLKQE